MSDVPYNPEWKKFEKGMQSDDVKESVRSAELFDQVRAEEMKKDKTAREWEEGRKKDIAKQKPAWKKAQMESEKRELDKPIKKLLNAGSFQYGIKPTPGHILIELDILPEETSSGIFLAHNSEEEPNTGRVLAVGSKLACKHCFAESRFANVSSIEPTPPPVEIGDNVLFKRLAGLMVDVKGKKARLMQFSDILGVFEDD